MIHVRKLKRTRFHTALTSIDPGHALPVDVQKTAIDTWGDTFPFVSVVGPVEPLKSDGVRWFRSNGPAQLRQAISVYMTSIPGNEICMFGNPVFALNGEVGGILKHIESEKIEMAWGCHINIKNAPSVFCMTTSVASHLLLDCPASLTFASSWQPYLHAWMGKMLRHRYFDATQYGLVEPILTEAEIEKIEPVSLTAPVATPVAVQQAPVAKKKAGRPRKNAA